MIEYFTVNSLVALTTLTFLEIVLGVDNIVIIAILTSRLPKEQQSMARRIGLFLAMAQRILLLACLNWLAHLTDPLFTFAGIDFSGRSLVLLSGGVFLVGKATLEIHSATEKDDEDESKKRKRARLMPTLIQITIFDMIFSLDSVITAVGMVDQLPIMVLAIVIAVLVMIIFANKISDFIMAHPTVKMLALAFLLLVGVFLVAEGTGRHIEKGYVYFAMGFAVLVEALNQRYHHKTKKKGGPQS